MVIEPEVLSEHAGREKVLIGEDVSERLDVIPARFRVVVTRRPKYAFKDAGGVIQALAPGHIIESGLPTEALLAQIAISKYADGSVGDLKLNFMRPYRARRPVHRSSLRPRLAGYFRWDQAGGGC